MMVRRVGMLVFIIKEASLKINSGTRRSASQQALPEVPGDRFAESLFERKNGLEAQLLAGLADVGHPAVRLHLLDLADVEQAVPASEEAPDAFRGDRSQIGRPQGQADGNGLLPQEGGGDAADVLPTVGAGVGDVEDLAARPARIRGQAAGPDGGTDKDEAKDLAAPAHGLDAAPDPAEELEKILVPGPVDGRGPQQHDGQAGLALQDQVLGLELAFSVRRDGPGRVVLTDAPSGRGGADGGQAAQMDETQPPALWFQGPKQICRAVPVYGIILARSEGFSQSGQVENAIQAGREDRQASEISGQKADAFDPRQPARLRRIADEGVDVVAGILEERLDEMASEEARSSRDQDAHGPDCMRFDRRGQ